MPRGRIFPGEQVTQKFLTQRGFLIRLGVLDRDDVVIRHPEMRNSQPLYLAIWLFMTYIGLCRNQIKIVEIKYWSQCVLQNVYVVRCGRGYEPDFDPAHLTSLQTFNNIENSLRAEDGIANELDLRRTNLLAVVLEVSLRLGG